jgi:hypothetical protein
VAQTVKITPASGLLEFIGNTTSNKPYLQHDDNGNLTLTLQATKKFTVAGNLKVNGKVTMAQQTLTDGAAITWDFNSGANAKVTIAGARTLVITNMEAGDTGLILVKQDAAGSRTLTLPGSSTIVGGGTYTASSAANATDVLGVYYDGSTYWWTIGYNTVTPPLTSVGITGSDFVIANSPLTSNGNIGLTLATVNSNVGTFGSATAVPVITVNAKGLVTAVSATNISIPTNLDSLTDVTISSAATGQLLQYNGSQWVNWTPNYLTGITSSQVTTALGYTPVPTTRTLSINGTSYDLSANRAWTIDTVNYVSRVQHGVKAGVAINKGQAVYVTSADGTNMIVGLASNGSEATSSKTMGLLDATVAINGMANVVTEGLLAGLNTSLAGTEGDPVWLGDSGNLIYGLPNKPYAPRHLVFIGIVTRKNQNNGEIFVKVQNGFELKEIHDVDLITTVPVNGHILGYDGTLWVNKTIAGWLGFTPANDANVVHTTGNESIAGIKTFSGTTQATSTSTGTIVTAGGVGIAKNLYVGGNINVVGNLVIGGTTTTVYAQNLAVSDNMIYLNNGIETTITNAVGNGSSVVYTTQETHNYVIGMSVTITGVSPTAYNLSNQTITGVSTNSFTIANSATGSYSSGGTARAKSNANPDLGFAAGYNDGSYAHAGLFRDATDNTWKFFKGYTPEPDASPFIDTSHASFAYADLRADNITGRSFIKVGGVSSEFLKADGSVDSNTYLTTGTASSSYQPLDADLTAIAGLATTGFLKRTGTNTWTLDSNVYLTAESDTLALVTARGATTAVATSFTGGASISNLLINGAAAYTEGSLALGAQGADEGGQFVLNKATSHTFAAHVDVWRNLFRVLYGTNAASAGTAMSLDLSTRQLILPAYQTPTSFTGTAAGVLAFDSVGNIITIAVPGGAVTSVNAGTGVSVNSTTGAVTVSIGQSVATSASPTFSQVLTTNNGGGTNVKLGDDIWIGDVNVSNTMGLVGVQNSDRAYITFGSDTTTALGRITTGDLTWGGNRIWHAGNLTNLNQLTNGPGYITGITSGNVTTALGYTPYNATNPNGYISSYTETDTLASVTGRGATTSTTLTLARVITTGLYGPGTSGNIAIWQYDSGNPGYGIVYNEGNPDTLRIDVSGQALTGTPDFLVGADYAQVNGNTVWHAGNLTNLNQLTNGPGYITTTGRAYPRRADGTNINFYWTGQSGQPSWLWGSNNGEDFYVWNPSNFSVAYASEAKWISFDDGPRDLTDREPNWNNRSVAWDFVTAGTADGVGNYAGVMTFSPWDGTSGSTGDSSYQLAFINETGLNASGVPGLRLRNGIDSTWNNWYQVWHSGNFTNNSSNWNTAYSKRPTALAFSGTGTKTLTLTLGDSSTLTASFSDIDTNTDSQTLSLSGSTLSISGGNSITLPTSGISQGTADSLYVNVSGDEMTGNLYVSPISGVPQIQLAGTNPEFYVSAKSGTARAFINRATSGNQATLMFTTGMNVFQGTAWDYTGMPMWTLGMTNNNNTDSFKIAYGDIYEPTSVALEITSANVAYFRNVPYGGGNLLATQAWVTSQGYLTALPSHNHDDRYYTESESDSRFAAISHNHTSLTGITSLAFSAQASDAGSITTTISGTSTYFDFNLLDDNSNDEWRWRFTPSGASVYDAMRLVPVTNTTSNLIVSGTITSSGGNSGNWNTAYGWGNHASSGYIVAGSTISDTGSWTNATKFKSSGDISNAGAGNHSLQIFSDTNNDAFIAFHISGDYAVYFGVDDATNRLHTGGWSEGAAKYQLWDSRDFSSTNISNWNTAYGWGNHASAGYLTSLPSHNHDDRYLVKGGSWYGLNLPGSRWGGYAANGGEIVFGQNLPNADQMSILVDGAYLAGENNGFWSLPSDNNWNGRRGMSWNGTYLDFTTNSPTAQFANLRLSNGFEIQNGGADYGRFSSWVHLNGYYGFYSGMNGAHLYPNNGSYGSWRMEGSRNSYQGIEFGSGDNGAVTLMIHVNSNVTGFMNTSYDWQFYWSGGTLYVAKNDYGGGTLATVLDSVNYTSYAATASHTHDDRYYTESESDSRFLRGTTNPSSVGNFTISIGNNGTYSYVQSHSGQPLRLNPVGNAVFVDSTLTVSGDVTGNNLNISNWNVAYSKRPTAIAFSGGSTKTLTLTQGDGSTLTASFSDIDTDTNTDAQTLTLNGSTLSISGGNSITLPSGGISQATADSLYVNVSGDTMTGALRINGSTLGQELFAVDGTNGRLFTVTDDLSDSLYSVNTIAGLPVLEVFANNVVTIGKFGTNAIYVGQDGRVGFGTTNFSYTASDTSGATGSPSNNRVFVNGSIQLLNGSDAFVTGRSGASFFKDEEIAFGWGGGWFMEDATYLRVRGNKMVYSGGSARFDDSLYLGGQTYRFYSANSGTWTNGNFGAEGDIYFGTRGTWLSNYLNQAVLTSSSPTFNDIYADNWFRNNGSNEGLYNQVTTQHWSSNTNGYWDASSTTSVSSIRFYTGGHMTSLRGYVYANSSNEIGFLNSAGNWGLRMDNSYNVQIYGTITATNFSGSSSGTNTGDQTTISGNAGSATVLQTARTLTIGNTGKTFDGSANVAWSLSEIGAQAAGSYAAASHTHDDRYYTESESDSRFINESGDTMSGRLTLKSISGVEQTVPNEYGAYLHLGSWGVGRTDDTAVLVNTAYRADYATDLFDMNISRFTNNSGYITSSGRAYPRRSDGGDLNFYWSGQSGQPTWLWGGTDGTNMYVYNPSNFSVNYAASAGSVAWGNVSGRPTALSSFTNDLGNYGGFLTSLPSHNHDGVYVPINPDGDGPSWSYADNNPTINGKYVGGGQRFGADGSVDSGFLQSKHLNAYDGHVNSSDGYYVGVIEYGSIPGVYDTTQVIDSSGRWTGVAIADAKIASSSNWNTAYGWGNHAGLYASSGHTHTFASLTSKPTTISGYGITDAITTGNIGSQSVNYASSAGSVAWTNVSGRPTALSQFTNDLGLGGAAVTIQDSAPAGTAGKLWWESDTGKLKVYYGSAWVDASPIPDMSLYYSKAGGSINGDVTVSQTLTVVGNTLIQGVLTETSDISLKENILPLENSLDKVMKLNGVSFNKKATPNMQEIGFIAQEVEAIIPDLVTETGEGIKTVSYSRVTAVLVETIKEQQTQINELKEMVNTLTKKLDNL